MLVSQSGAYTLITDILDNLDLTDLFMTLKSSNYKFFKRKIKIVYTAMRNL